MTVSFGEALEACIAAIPRGRVATCGTIARALGDVRAARSVATWVREHPDLPRAYRVVRADGRALFPETTETLAREGVHLRGDRVTEEDFVRSVSAPSILEELRAEQRDLAAEVSECDERAVPETVGGVDVSYAGDRAYAVAARLDARTLEVLETSERETAVSFPYIPTYLAFREFSPVQAALDGLKERPDLLFVDGHGRLHPALFGFACLVGVKLDLPTVGIAKHPLAGRPVPSGRMESSAIPLEMNGVTRGFAWIAPGAVRPFYVSVGHRISLRGALSAAQKATRRRYPEPLVVADRISKEMREEKNAKGSASGRTTRARPPAQGREGV